MVNPGQQPDHLRPVMAEVVHSPYPPPARRRSVFAVLVVLFLLLVLGGSIVLNLALLAGGGSFSAGRKVQEEHFLHAKGGRNKVAIISVEGLIYEYDGFAKKQIDRAMEDDSVKAIVLRVDSPGGSVNAADYLYHHLSKLAEKRRIPVVVSMGGLAASGGYYVAMAVGDAPDRIYAEPLTLTGSIGVIVPLYNVSQLMKEWGISEDSVVSHPLKEMGSPTKPMTEEEREIFQSLVDDSFRRFKEVIRAGRPKFKKDPQALDKLATGQIYSADQALKAGLVDKLGFLEDAVDRAIALAGLDPQDTHVIRYKPEPTLSSLVWGRAAPRQEIDLAAILDLASPRAYFLYSRFPPLVRSRP